MSPTSDTRASDEDDKTPPQASPVKQSASPLASGSDEGDKRDASPLAKVVPASGGSSNRHSFWSGAVQSKSKGSKGAEKGMSWLRKGKGKGKREPGKLASGSIIHPTARYSQQHPQQPWHLVSRDLAEATARWQAWPSCILLEPGGLSDFAQRNTSLLWGGLFARAFDCTAPDDPSAAAWREEGWGVPATGGAGDMLATGGAPEA